MKLAMICCTSAILKVILFFFFGVGVVEALSDPKPAWRWALNLIRRGDVVPLSLRCCAAGCDPTNSNSQASASTAYDLISPTAVA